MSCLYSCLQKTQSRRQWLQSGGWRWGEWCVSESSFPAPILEDAQCSPGSGPQPHQHLWALVPRPSLQQALP